MKNQLKRRKKEQEAQPALSFPATGQPSGYSSASFYDLSSLPPSKESSIFSEFEYSSPSETSSFVDDISAVPSDHTSTSLSLVSVVSSLARTKPSAGSSSNSEYCSSNESGPTFEKLNQVASGDAGSLGHSSGVVDSVSPNLSWDGDPTDAWPASPPLSATASHKFVVSSPASSLASGPSELPQRADHPGNMNELSSEDESDLGGPVRFAVYSPHITLKDQRGECSCWQEKNPTVKSLKVYTKGI